MKDQQAADNKGFSRFLPLLVVVALLHRVISANSLDETPITARTAIRRDDAVVGLVFRAFSFKSERYHGGQFLAGRRAKIARPCGRGDTVG